MQHIEGFVQTTIDTLKQELPGAIQVENELHGDFQIPTPKDESYFFGGDESQGVVLRYPQIEVAAPDWMMSEFSLGQQTSALELTLIVRAWLQQDAEIQGFQNLYRATLRYGRSLLRVLTRPDALGHSTITAVRGFYRVNPETGERDEPEAASMLLFQLEDVELAE
jgi:hypothetical protein